MSNSNLAIKIACYLIKFIIFIANYILNASINSFRILLRRVFNVNMSEVSKKRKNKPEHNQTVKRGAIDANWQKLLSSVLMDGEKEEIVQKKDHFTGTFRRARKKNKNTPTLNVDNTDLCNLSITNENSENKKRETKRNKLTKFLAMDCEMVGVGFDGNDHMLARISIVNKFGDCIYDKFVKARETVVDYRTNISGIRKEDLLNGEEFMVVQKEVAELLKDRILVGHSLENDLKVLFLSHPKKHMRDTSRYKPFRKITKGSTPSLKRLAKEILNIDIQEGEHSSVEDARAAMQLYCTVAKEWEQVLSQKRGYSRKFVES